MVCGDFIIPYFEVTSLFLLAHIILTHTDRESLHKVSEGIWDNIIASPTGCLMKRQAASFGVRSLRDERLRVR